MNGDTKIVFIVNIDIHCVASMNSNHRPWEAVIYSHHALRAAQPCEIGLFQLQDIKKRETKKYFYQTKTGVLKKSNKKRKPCILQV